MYAIRSYYGLADDPEAKIRGRGYLATDLELMVPMGMADIAEVLWNDFLSHNPANP